MYSLVLLGSFLSCPFFLYLLFDLFVVPVYSLALFVLCICLSGRDTRWGHFVCFFHMKPPSSHQMTHWGNHRRDRNFDVFRVIRHKLMIMMAIGPMILLKPQSWDSQVWKSHNFDVIWSIGLRVIKSVPNLSQMSLFSSFYRFPSQKWTLQLSHQQNQVSS